MRPVGILLVLALGFSSLVSPGWADPREDLDPVETASASLTRHLTEHQAEVAELSWRIALEQNRHRILASLASVRSHETALGYLSLDWLLSRNNPAVTGIQPIAGRQGLLVSFDIPLDDPLAFLRGRSFTYDNAIGAIALLLQGRPSAARGILDNLASLMSPEGSLGFSYQVDSVLFDPMVRTGTLAWVGYAFSLYQRITGDDRFLNPAIQIAEYLKNLQDPASGSLRGGPDVTWISTEHNLDAHAFYALLHHLTGNSSYRTLADQIKTSLLRNHWDANRRRFLQGIGDPTPALDANLLGAVFLKAIGRTRQARQALHYVESVFKTRKRIPGSRRSFLGYAPDAHRRTIWLEGTVTAAFAYRRIGLTGRADSVLRQVKRVQDVWISQGQWNGGLPYALPRWVNPDGDTFLDRPSVSSTGWLLIELATSSGETRFWDLE